jgi:thiamine-monophosphate kinase
MDEFDIIRRYFINALMPNYVTTGPGDDCAVLSVPDGCELCVSTDTLLAGVHFPIDATPEVVVNRAFAANLSDLAAMGAEPHGVTMALTFPDANEVWLDAFSKATAVWSKTIPLIGGNLSKGPLSITLTVMGVVPRGTAILRSGALVDDDLYVSGDLGDAAGAVRELGAANANAALMQQYESPIPRLELGQALRGVASAAIDISDGFLSDLGHLLQSSQVAGQLDLDQVPLSDTLVQVFGAEDALSLGLSGGDDYELCFTAAAQHRDAIQVIAKELNLSLVRLGKIVGGEPMVQDGNGNQLDVSGYKHFQGGS